jgi:hypothetical protein
MDKKYRIFFLCISLSMFSLVQCWVNPDELFETDFKISDRTESIEATYQFTFTFVEDIAQTSIIEFTFQPQDISLPDNDDHNSDGVLIFAGRTANKLRFTAAQDILIADDKPIIYLNNIPNPVLTKYNP